MSDDEKIDFGKKKKKKEKKEKKDKGGDDDAAPAVVEKERQYYPFTAGTMWDYEDLLSRVHETIATENKGFGLKEKYIVKPPEVVRVGSKRSCWSNFQLICKQLNRTPDHVMNYALVEFSAEGTLAGSGQLLLKGRFQPKNIETLLRKYIKGYVQCNMCKSANTVLERDNATRLHMVKCNNCGAQRSAANIRTGYHGVKKGQRKAAKYAAGSMQITG